MRRIAFVVAIAENGVIGDRGALPWRLSDDLKWFRQITMGKPVIMGRKTFESVGKPLPGRRNIVVTRDEAWRADGVERAVNPNVALDLAGDVEEVCVIGGAEIYRALLPLCDRLYLTRVDAAPEGDTRFPSIAWNEWRAERIAAAEKSARNDHACEFFILDKIRHETGS